MISSNLLFICQFIAISSAILRSIYLFQLFHVTDGANQLLCKQNFRNILRFTARAIFNKTRIPYIEHHDYRSNVKVYV